MRQPFPLLLTGRRTWDDTAVSGHVRFARDLDRQTARYATAAAYAARTPRIPHRGAPAGLAAPRPGRRAATEREDVRLER
jgi:hypothetical protein